MRKKSKIYVAGHTGLVGSAILANLISKGYNNIVTRVHQELDLTDQCQVKNFFLTEKAKCCVDLLKEGMYAPSRSSFIASRILLDKKNLIFLFLQYFFIFIISSSLIRFEL